MVSYNVVVGDSVTKVLVRMFRLSPTVLLGITNENNKSPEPITNLPPNVKFYPHIIIMSTTNFSDNETELLKKGLK